MKCLHQFERTGTEDLGDRVLTKLSCTKCSKKRTVNRKKPRYVAQDAPRKSKVKRVPKLSKLLQSPRKRQRKAIKPVSDKRKMELAKYSKLRGAFLSENPLCAVTGKIATEVHHRCGREGKWLLDTEWWLPVSREGHDWIENNRSAAMDRRWLILRKSST